MKREYKRHARSPNGELRTLCGLGIEQGQDNHLPIAHSPKEITCRNCLQFYYQNGGARL